MLQPSLLPIDLYEASGRDKTMGDILFRLTDHHGRDFALGPTHEEAFVEVFKRNVQSYRDMPQLLYQIALKFRDEPRPRGGLIRLRQFIMKDLYSFDTDWEGLDRSYQLMFDAYQRIFDRCGVPTLPVLADSGVMGGKDTHQFTFLTDIGEDTCLLCPNCGYAADSEVAAFTKEPAHAGDAAEPMEEIDTPNQKTIAELAAFLSFRRRRRARRCSTRPLCFPRRAKSLHKIPVMVAIRGDMDVNEAKLRQALKAIEVVYMDDDAVKKAGFVAGSAGAVRV